MPIDFNRFPYYDDFTSDDNYYRLLFRPGRAVQARELTQIQTLLQSQISKLSSHLFKDGSLVSGGQVGYDRTGIKWLAVQPTFEGTPIRITSFTPGLSISRPAATELSPSRGTIDSVFPAENGDPNTIYFTWDQGEPENINKDGFFRNELLVLSDKASGVSKYRVKTMDSESYYGNSAHLKVTPGIYYWKGMFVQSPGGSVVLSKYSNSPTIRVGYFVKQEVITDDPKTLDPASNYSNYSAPGADRYKITLTLAKIGDGVNLSRENVTNFIEIARVEGGTLLLSDLSAGETIYSVLGDKIARRTFEESGNYIAKRYNIQLKNKTTKDNPNMTAHLSDGVSYVNGYRYGQNFASVFNIRKGRDTINETLNLNNNYGDNYLIMYNEGDTNNLSNPENANGTFVVGSGAGVHTSSDAFGQRGAAVSIHSVPKDLVERYSLTDEWKWRSTLVGTARPFQFLYDDEASNKSAAAGRNGSSYDLYLSDYKSSNISNAVSVDNVITLTRAYVNSTGYGNFEFNTKTHGITTEDRVSISGVSSDILNLDFYPVNFANSTHIVVYDTSLPATSIATDGGRLYRTTGNLSPSRTVVLDTYSSAAWNGSYIGGTIVLEGSSPKRIIDYIGTEADATANYSSQQGVGWSRAGLVIVDSDFDTIPQYGNTYTINLPMTQARSVVYNHNISATGADQYPALLNQSWNVDPISGVDGSKDKLSNRVYGGRVDGDTGYNRYGNDPDGEDTLLFDIGRKAVKSTLTHGTLSSGLSGNTEFYYTEYSKKAGATSGPIYFDVGDGVAGTYKYFERPHAYPYLISAGAVTDKTEIRRNYILTNETTGDVVTNAITSVVYSDATHQLAVYHTGTTFSSSHNLILQYPAKATQASPAYKKLIKANTTHSGKTAESTLTDYANGHVHFESGTYSTVSGARLDLGKPDVFKIHKVIHQIRHTDVGVNGSSGDIANTQLDIKDRFVLDTGQRDTFYDNAALVLKTNANAPTGNVLVIFDRFQRVDNPKGQTQTEDLSSPGFFSVDSYQYTTDLTLDHAAGQSPFTVGMEVRANNSGVTGYVLEYSNTSGYFAKVRLQDVRGPVGTSNPTFVVDETITGYNSSGTSISANVVSVVEADLKYSEIPEYKSLSGKIYPLRNMIDARPYVSTNDRVSETISDSMTPFIPTSNRIKAGKLSSDTNPMNTEVIADSFAGRIDKIIVTSEGSYKNDEGVPAFEKYPPKDRPDKEALTLFTINIPPYTFDPSNVQIKENPAIRHTMRDIGRLAKRVENLEYYVSLNLLEQQMAELEITDENGLSRFKNGIVVDNFNSDSVMSKGLDNKNQISGGELRPQHVLRDTYGEYLGFSPFSLTGVTLFNKYYDATSDEYNADGSRLMLDCTEEPLIVQSLATSSETVNPFNVQDFSGDLKLTPEVDHWIDMTKVPEYSSLLNTIFEVITELSEENSTTDEIVNAILTMGDFWNDVSGNVPLGDDITVVGTHYETPTQSTILGKNIQLGTTSFEKRKYWTSAELDAAIQSHGMTDGATRNLRLIPYMRSRDVILNAGGLKPNHTASIRFDGTNLDGHFARATEVYMNYNPRTAGSNLFQPDVNGKYEKVKLTGGGFTANGILLAIREPRYLRDPILSSPTSRYMVGYVVPCPDDDTGLIDYSTYKDGYYPSAWDDNNIKTYGWQGTGSRTITGYKSGVSVSLIGTGTQTHYYNGHYSGSARNSTSNTTHVVLSPDAHRYRKQNFRKYEDQAAATTDGYAEDVRIKIVAGAGVGQEAVANSITLTDTTAPVITLRQPLTTAIDSTSVYSISMKAVNPYDDRYTVSQIGDAPNKTNHYGEKFGILRIPSNDRTRFTVGRKLVEITDRYGFQPWKITSYASGYYEAAGQSTEVVSTDLTPDRLNLLKEIRTKVNGWRIHDHPDDLGYIPARTGGTGDYGKLAVVTGVTFDFAGANGTWTAEETDSVAWVSGNTEYGVISTATQQHYRDRFIGVWSDIAANHPEVYEQYYKGYFDLWVRDSETPDQDT